MERPQTARPVVRSLLALAQLLPIVQSIKRLKVVVVEAIVMVASDRLSHRGARAAVLALFIFVLPPLLWTLLIWTDRSSPRAAGLAGGIATLAVAMLPGIAAIWQLRMRVSTRWLISTLYCAGMGAALLFWGLLFACAALHDCP